MKPQHQRFPYLISPKIDGFRCFIHGGVPRLSSKDPVPNIHIREYLSRNGLSGMDGELCVGPANESEVINRTQKLVSSHNRRGEWTFNVFDNFLFSGNYARRLSQLTSTLEVLSDPRIILVPHQIVHNEYEMESLNADFVDEGYEGSMLTHPDAPYDFGRCTPREAYMIKLKNYHDEEAEIVGFNERMHNSNPLQVDLVTGRKSRSSAGDCDVGLGVLGSFVLRHPVTGFTFSCGSGLDDGMAAEYWRIRETLLGQFVTYKTMSYGSKNVPRHPIFKCIRSEVDIEPCSNRQGELL